jgi:hypothetical protein
MSQAKPVAIQIPDGATIQGSFYLWDESPGDPDSVRLELSFQGRSVTADSGVGYFDALAHIRQQIEPDGYRLLCFGASKGVYPSGMSRSMGVGDKAYKLEMGKATVTKDLVSIFDSDASVVPATLEEQQASFDEWMESLR